MDYQAQTIKTYDESAKELAEYFGGIGSRVGDIELGLKLAGASTDAKVVEVGCGDGRDAEEIVKRVDWYEGFDPSEGLLGIAKKKLPESSFVKANALTYDYPEDLDVIYAFASLLHVGREDMKTALAKIHAVLRPDGVLYVSLKERATYQEEVKEDKYGKRMFYYYNPEIFVELAGSGFVPIHEDHQRMGETEWFTLALKKRT